MTKEELLQKVERDLHVLPEVVAGVSSSKPAIRYCCAKLLVDLSEEHPEELYQYMTFFTNLLDSKYRILAWNAMAIIANLARVDKDKKFDAIFDKYYSSLNDEYMVTVANVVDASARIALAKPYLIQRITNELLEVENIPMTSHLTEECKRVIAEKAIQFFDMFFNRIETKERVVSFARKCLDSQRKTLKMRAENFLRKWNL
jgi:hypothetical protein